MKKLLVGIFALLFMGAMAHAIPNSTDKMSSSIKEKTDSPPRTIHDGPRGGGGKSGGKGTNITGTLGG